MSNQAAFAKKEESERQVELQALKAHLSERVIGQDVLVERMLIALLADGHLLVEGAPGLAKTRAIKELGESVEGNFHRVQFTPDLLPADLTGTEIYRPQDGSFKFRPGPLFHNLILADEINRAPAKVQSALLEAMAERQITVGSTTYKLPALFLVMATQNPLEHEGTYPLPEAQLDRFLMHIRIDYPKAVHEKEILRLARREAAGKVRPGSVPVAPLTQETVFAARGEILDLYMTENLEEYLLQLALAGRNLGVEPGEGILVGEDHPEDDENDDQHRAADDQSEAVALTELRDHRLASFPGYVRLMRKSTLLPSRLILASVIWAV